jgi:threonylcarbamoyladenosine tRNA methylthiotransferase MtaB
MGNQVEERVKSERSELIRLLSEQNRLGYMQSMLQTKQRVLVEKVESNGVARGYGEHYLPVQFQGNGARRNSFANVVLNSINPSDPPIVEGSLA